MDGQSYDDILMCCWHYLPLTPRAWNPFTWNARGIFLGSDCCDHIRNTEIAGHTMLLLRVDLIIGRCSRLFGHVARLWKDTPVHQALQHQIDICFGLLPNRTWKRPPGHPRSKSLLQQPTICWSVEMCYPTRTRAQYLHLIGSEFWYLA